MKSDKIIRNSTVSLMALGCFELLLITFEILFIIVIRPLGSILFMHKLSFITHCGREWIIRARAWLHILFIGAAQMDRWHFSGSFHQQGVSLFLFYQQVTADGGWCVSKLAKFAKWKKVRGKKPQLVKTKIGFITIAQAKEDLAKIDNHCNFGRQCIGCVYFARVWKIVLWFITTALHWLVATCNYLDNLASFVNLVF